MGPTVAFPLSTHGVSDKLRLGNRCKLLPDNETDAAQLSVCQRAACSLQSRLRSEL